MRETRLGRVQLLMKDGVQYEGWGRFESLISLRKPPAQSLRGWFCMREWLYEKLRCPREDLNLHARRHRPSTCRVCQFRHWGT